MEYIEIGKNLKLLSGFPFSSKYFSNESGFPLIRIRDILTSKVETYYNGPYIETYVVKQGDILIGMDGDFHVVKWCNDRGLLNQRILKVEVSDPNTISLRFIFYWLGPYIQHVNNIAAATTVKHLSVKDLYKAKGLIPEIEKQKKIATILETIDQAIEKTEALIHKYQQIKAGLMHDLFTRGLTADGNLRSSREQARELYQETPIGWIPKDWDTVLLGEISNIVRGSTPRPAKDPKYFDGDYIPWITVGELSRKDWPYLNNTSTMLTEQGAKYSRVLNTGTLVISNSGYGCGVPKILKITGCANDGIAAFLDLLNSCNQLFIYYYLHSQIMTLRKKVARGNDQPNLNTDMLSEFRIALPKINEQKAISERLWSIDKMIKCEKTSLEKLSLLKAGLMHDLLTGKVPVAIDKAETAHV
jgi:type I restriction enzyme S subunit